MFLEVAHPGMCKLEERFWWSMVFRHLKATIRSRPPKNIKVHMRKLIFFSENWPCLQDLNDITCL